MEARHDRRDHRLWRARTSRTAASGWRQQPSGADRDGEWPDFDARGRELRRTLELLVDGGPVTIQDLREQGIEAPGQAMYELQLSGCDVERVARTDAAGHTLSAYRIGLRRIPAIASSPASATADDR